MGMYACSCFLDARTSHRTIATSKLLWELGIYVQDKFKRHHDLPSNHDGQRYPPDLETLPSDTDLPFVAGFRIH
jgi:hypothetical protein